MVVVHWLLTKKIKSVGLKALLGQKKIITDTSNILISISHKPLLSMLL